MAGAKTITVCGCGNAGTAIAADLSLMGHRVNVYEVPEFEENLKPVRKQQGIKITGNTICGKTGMAPLNKISSNAEEAVQDTEVFMITVPAHAHANVIKSLVPFLTSGQSLIVNTGYWASLRFKPLLEEHQLLDKVSVIETNIMPYLSGRLAPGHVHVYNYKKVLKISTWPARKNEEAIKLVKEIYPQAVLSKNVIENNFYPGNPSVHAQIVLPKASFFFDRAREFRFYGEVSQSAAKLSTAFEKERMAVANAYECETILNLDSTKEIYGYQGNDMFEMYINSEHAKRWSGIEGLYRILQEDLCYFFVPMEQLAKIAQIDVPVTGAMIELLHTYTGFDYRKNGVSLEELGMDNLTKQQIIDYVTTGSIA